MRVEGDLCGGMGVGRCAELGRGKSIRCEGKEVGFSWADGRDGKEVEGGEDVKKLTIMM